MRRDLDVFRDLVDLTQSDDMFRKNTGNRLATSVGSLRDPERYANKLGKDLIL